MNGVSLPRIAMQGMVATTAAAGAATGAYSAVRESGRADAAPLQKLGTSLGIPVMGVGLLLSTASAGRTFPAALLGAVGLGTIGGTFVAAFSQ